MVPAPACASARANGCDMAATVSAPVDVRSVRLSMVIPPSRALGQHGCRPQLAPCEISRRAAGVNKDDDVVFSEAAFADVRNQSSRSLAGVDRIEDHALGPGEQLDGFCSGFRRLAVAGTNE